MNFQSQSNPKVDYSPESDVYTENFGIGKSDTDPKKPLEVLKASGSRFTPFLERTGDKFLDDSGTQLMSSPVLKHQNHPIYDNMEPDETTQKANIFTPSKNENKENTKQIKSSLRSQKSISKVI